MVDFKYALKQIDFVVGKKKGVYPPKIKIQTEIGETKWIDVSWESLNKLRSVLRVSGGDRE